MKVTKEATGDLTAVLRIDISSEDYANKVEEQLKNYRKKANVPGFRPGQVPMGMIKKLYEKSLRAEEIQKLLTDSMYDFIESEKIRTLGHPLANDEKTGDIDWDNQNEFTFYFDIAIKPEIELNLENVEETYYNIVPTEEMINKFIEEIQRTNIPSIYLLTLDDAITLPKVKQMANHNVILVVPKGQAMKEGIDEMKNVISFEEYLYEEIPSHMSYWKK